MLSTDLSLHLPSRNILSFYSSRLLVFRLWGINNPFHRICWREQTGITQRRNFITLIIKYIWWFSMNQAMLKTLDHAEVDAAVHRNTQHHPHVPHQAWNTAAGAAFKHNNCQPPYVDLSCFNIAVRRTSSFHQTKREAAWWFSICYVSLLYSNDNQLSHSNVSSCVNFILPALSDPLNLQIATSGRVVMSQRGLICLPI